MKGLLSKLIGRSYLPKFNFKKGLKTSGYILGSVGIGLGAGYAEKKLVSGANYIDQFIYKNGTNNAFKYNLGIGYFTFGAATERQNLLKNMNESDQGPRQVLGKEASMYSSFL